MELIRRRRSPGVGVHVELQRIRGRLPGRPGRQPGHGLRRVDRGGRLAQHGLLRTAECGGVALLRVRDRHRSVGGNRDHAVRGRPRRLLHQDRVGHRRGELRALDVVLDVARCEHAVRRGVDAGSGAVRHDAQRDQDRRTLRARGGRPESVVRLGAGGGDRGGAGAARRLGLLLAGRLAHRLCVGLRREQKLFHRWGKLDDDLAHVLLAGDVHGGSARERQPRRDGHSQPYDHGRRRTWALRAGGGGDRERDALLADGRVLGVVVHGRGRRRERGSARRCDARGTGRARGGLLHGGRLQRLLGRRPGRSRPLRHPPARRSSSG